MADIPTSTRVALARQRYREGMPFKAILAETGLTPTAVHRCLAGDYPDGSGVAPAPIPLRYAGALAPRDGPNGAVRCDVCRDPRVAQSVDVELHLLRLLNLSTCLAS